MVMVIPPVDEVDFLTGNIALIVLVWNSSSVTLGSFSKPARSA
jgi:hypothetical protein